MRSDEEQAEDLAVVAAGIVAEEIDMLASDNFFGELVEDLSEAQEGQVLAAMLSLVNQTRPTPTEYRAAYFRLAADAAEIEGCEGDD